MTFRLGRPRLGDGTVGEQIIVTHQRGDAPDHRAVDGIRAVMRTNISRSLNAWKAWNRSTATNRPIVTTHQSRRRSFDLTSPDLT
jgi:hypothetical protein